MRFVLLFMAGFIMDFVETIHVKSVADRKVWSATLFSGIITICNYLLITVMLTDSL